MKEFAPLIDINQTPTPNIDAVYIANTLNATTSKATSAISHSNISQKQPRSLQALRSDTQDWKISLLGIIKNKISLRVNYLKKLISYVASLVNERGEIVEENKDKAEGLLIDFFGDVSEPKNRLNQQLYLQQLIEGANIKCNHYLDLLKIFTRSDLDIAISSLQILLETYSVQAVKNTHNPKTDLKHIFKLLNDENYLAELCNILQSIMPKNHNFIETVVTSHPTTGKIHCDNSALIKKADILWKKLLAGNRLKTEWITYLNSNYKESAGKIRWLALMVENGNNGIHAFNALIKKDIDESKLLNNMQLTSQDDSVMAEILQNVSKTYKILEALDRVEEWISDEKVLGDANKSKLSTPIGKFFPLKNSDSKINDKLKEVLYELNDDDIKVLQTFFDAAKKISYNNLCRLLSHIKANIRHIEGSHYIIEINLFSCSINTSYKMDKPADASTKEKDTTRISHFNRQTLIEFFEKIGINQSLLNDIYAERGTILTRKFTK